MEFLPRLGVAVVISLMGLAFIIWGAKMSVFNGIWLLLEELLPDSLRTILRRVVNTCIGLLFILFAVLIFLLAKPSADSAAQSGSTGDTSAPVTRSSN